MHEQSLFSFPPMDTKPWRIPRIESRIMHKPNYFFRHTCDRHGTNSSNINGPDISMSNLHKILHPTKVCINGSPDSSFSLLKLASVKTYSKSSELHKLIYSSELYLYLRGLLLWRSVHSHHAPLLRMNSLSSVELS